MMKTTIISTDSLLGLLLLLTANSPVIALPAPVVILTAETMQGATSGADVSTWPDISGHNDSATSRMGASPTVVASAVNNLPVVHFDADKGQFLTIRRPVQDDFTIVCVFRSTQGLGTGAAYFAGAGLVQGEVPGVVSDFGLALNASGQLCAGTGDPDKSIVSKLGYNDGQVHIVTFTRHKSDGQMNLYVDGVRAAAPVTAGTQSLVAPVRLGIGALMNGGLGFTGDIAEIEIYDSTLSDADRASVEGALGAKWGIAGIPKS